MPLQTNYLERFRHILGAEQSAQIFGKLQLDKDQGNLRSLSEYRKELESLIPKIKDRLLSPLAQQLQLTQGNNVGTPALNNTLSLLSSDLLAAFEEVNNIDRILTAQKTLMFKAVSQDLKKIITRLRGEVEIHELLASLNQFNSQTYGSSVARVDEGEFVFAERAQRDYRLLYVDPLTATDVPRKLDCSLGKNDELKLPIKASRIHRPRSARVIVENTGSRPSQASEYAVDLDDLGPANAIDGQDGTYWARSVLLTTPRSGDPAHPTAPTSAGVFHKLEVEFQELVSFNYIEIEPILSSEAYLVAVEAFKEGAWTTLWETTTFDGGIRLRGARVLHFATAQATKVKLTFESRSYRTVTFLTASDHEQTDAETAQSALEELLYGTFPTAKVQEVMGLVEQTFSEREYVEYFLGIDNVYVGLASFEEKGIFVSRPVNFGRLASIGIAGDWLLPYRELTSLDVQYTDTVSDFMPVDIATVDPSEMLGSIEFYLCKWDYADKDKTKLLRREVFPVMPLFIGRYTCDRLLLTKKESGSTASSNDVGMLRFMPFGWWPTGVAATDLATLKQNLFIFRDGQRETAWQASATYSNVAINNGAPMQLGIFLTSPVRESAYVAMYRGEFSNLNGKPQDSENTALLHYLDVLGDTSLTVNEHGFYEFDAEDDQNVVASEVAVIVMLRNNGKGRFPGVTPVLKNFRLVAFERPVDEE